MDTKQENLLLKIVIGAAWSDRRLEPAEVEHFQQLLQQYHLHLDSALQKLLEQPVPLEQTEFWLVEYLRDSTNTERQRLLSEIASMLIADDNVSDIEHDLLDEYYRLMAKIPPHPESLTTLAPTLGRFIKRLLSSVRQLRS
ncbi:MAG: TerB family tellurite resistance protein [Cyanobacteria bacterium P01_H01_bin.15]